MPFTVRSQSGAECSLFFAACFCVRYYWHDASSLQVFLLFLFIASVCCYLIYLLIFHIFPLIYTFTTTSKEFRGFVFSIPYLAASLLAGIATTTKCTFVHSKHAAHRIGICVCAQEVGNKNCRKKDELQDERNQQVKGCVCACACLFYTAQVKCHDTNEIFIVRPKLNSI